MSTEALQQGRRSVDKLRGRLLPLAHRALAPQAAAHVRAALAHLQAAEAALDLAAMAHSRDLAQRG